VKTDFDQDALPLVAGGILCGGDVDRYGIALRVEGPRGAFWGKIHSVSVGLGLLLWHRQGKLECWRRYSATFVEIA
jgi:hypothetical protein